MHNKQAIQTLHAIFLRIQKNTETYLDTKHAVKSRKKIIETVND